MKSSAAEKISKKTKGGARPGAGRQKGSPNKRTAETQKAVEESGITPLEFMLQIMRQEPGEIEDERIALDIMAMRFEAAKAAAPYVHAKLSSVEMNAKVTTRTLDQELAELNAVANAGSGPSVA
jgi:hypothetical protein